MLGVISQITLYVTEVLTILLNETTKLETYHFEKVYKDFFLSLHTSRFHNFRWWLVL